MIQAQVLIDKHFLTNFLTLSLMVNIYKAERELPENKIELYKKCFEYIAKKREMEKGSRNSYDWDKVSVLMKDSTFISLSTLAAPNNTGLFLLIQTINSNFSTDLSLNIFIHGISRSRDRLRKCTA